MRQSIAASSGPAVEERCSQTHLGSQCPGWPKPRGRAWLSPVRRLCGTSSPAAPRGSDSLGQTLTQQLGAFPGSRSRTSGCGINQARGAGGARVAHVLFLGSVSSGCNCSWLLLSAAAVQWPRCKSNENAVSPCF